jgi:hypothetical protein
MSSEEESPAFREAVRQIEAKYRELRREFLTGMALGVCAGMALSLLFVVAWVTVVRRG